MFEDENQHWFDGTPIMAARILSLSMQGVYIFEIVGVLANIFSGVQNFQTIRCIIIYMYCYIN